MTRYMDDYLKAAQAQLAAVTNTQRAAMDRAADWVCETLMKDHFLYAFGSGHSHALAEEVFYRAGGMARVIPILDANLMVHINAAASTEWERKEGYAKQVLARY